MRKIKYSTPAYKKYTQQFGICLLLILLSGCSRPPDTLEHSAELPFSITWQPQIPRAEQSIVFSLTLPSELTPQLSEVRGITMYMGRIPLQWQALEPGVWQATLLVGACSEPTMQWQLTVPLKLTHQPAGDEAFIEPIRVTFTTVTN